LLSRKLSEGDDNFRRTEEKANYKIKESGLQKEEQTTTSTADRDVNWTDGRTDVLT